MSKYFPIVQCGPGETIIARILGGPVLVAEHWMPRENRFAVCYHSELFATLHLPPCANCPDADRRMKAYFGANIVRNGSDPIVGLLPLTELAYMALGSESPAGFKLRIQRTIDRECSRPKITVEERGWPAGMKRPVCPDIVRVLWNIWGVLRPSEAPHVFEDDKNFVVRRNGKPKIPLGTQQKKP